MGATTTQTASKTNQIIKFLQTNREVKAKGFDVLLNKEAEPFSVHLEYERHCAITNLLVK